MYKKILVLTDRPRLYKIFKEIILKLKLDSYNFEFRCSPENKELKNFIKEIDLQRDLNFILDNFDLVFSLHCSQVFPKKLVKKIRCINIHPGYNPFNRGWFPHVFSIINKKPAGVSIHEMDEKIDHGPIIDQKMLKIYPFDTSLTVYNRLLKLEKVLLKKNIKRILAGNYKTRIPDEGNINFKKDFDSLCKLDLENNTKLEKFLDILRALTHPPYNNAYFLDDNGNKIYLRINFESNKNAKIS